MASHFIGVSELPIPNTILEKDPQAVGEVLEGQQTVAKFNTNQPHLVHVTLACIRLPSVNSDILITLNEPENLAAASLKALFSDSLSSLRIADWKLFPTA